MFKKFPGHHLLRKTEGLDLPSGKKTNLGFVASLKMGKDEQRCSKDEQDWASLKNPFFLSGQ